MVTKERTFLPVNAQDTVCWLCQQSPVTWVASLGKLGVLHQLLPPSVPPVPKRPSRVWTRHYVTKSRRDDQGRLLNACASRALSPEFAQTSSHCVAAARVSRRAQTAVRSDQALSR